LIKYRAFIDESGTAELDTSKQGASKYFIVSAVLVNETNLDEITEKAESIRLKYFQKGEMKSSKIKDTKDNFKRRIIILDEVLKLDFKFFALVVDKSVINRDSGLKYKRSFMKFINALLYKRLYKTIPELTIYADEHGSNDFKASFSAYIYDNHIPDLFYRSGMEMVSSSSNVLVQIADFLVGTLSKVYELKANPALREKYIELIETKMFDLIEWPTTYQSYFSADTTTQEFDKEIHAHALNMAERHLEELSNSNDSDDLIRLTVLRHLVFLSRMSANPDYLSTGKLLDYLHSLGHTTVTEHQIRSLVIASLRDNEVIIASCNRGYKIPNQYSDLHDFVERVNSQVLPLLDRLNIARKSYLLSTDGEVDLLKGIDYPRLVEILDLLDTKKIFSKTNNLLT
jgi:hypothetical protein